MKMIFAAAVIAAFATATPGFTQESASGHYEWQTRQVPGPNKSNITSRVRVWVKDAPHVVHCDCDMMKVNAADCMKQMSGQHRMPSEG